jgi:hypothetical protein
MRRAMPQVVVAGVLMVVACLAALLPSSASAQPVRVSAPPSCPTGNSAYPPTPDATVQSNTTMPRAGDSIEVSGTHYCADEDVTITIGGHVVGTAHTDAQGAFDPKVAVPGPAGDHRLCGTGASGLDADRDCLNLTTLTTGAAGGAAASTSAEPGAGGGSGGGGGTAFTGTDAALLVALALILVAGGVAFSTAGRRHKSMSQA